MNGYFIRYFVVTFMGNLNGQEPVYTRQSQGTGGPGGNASPCPRRDGRILTSTDTPCPNENKSYIVNKDNSRYK